MSALNCGINLLQIALNTNISYTVSVQIVVVLMVMIVFKGGGEVIDIGHLD